MSYRIPAAPIVEIINAYCAERPDASLTQEGGQWMMLAERADVKYEWLEKVMYGRSKEIQFNMADRLMCAMNTTYLWHSPELYDIYMSVDLSDTRFCANPECGVEFPVTDGSHKIYCTERCLIRARTIRTTARRKAERETAAA